MQNSNSSLIHFIHSFHHGAVASLVSHSSLSWSSTKVSENVESSLVHSRMLPFCFLQRGVVAVAILTTLVVCSVLPRDGPETPRSESCRRRPSSQASTVHHQKPVACNSASLLRPCWESGATCRCCAAWAMCSILDSPLSCIAFNFRFVWLLVSLICSALCTAWHYDGTQSS